MTDFLGRGWRFPVRVNARGELGWVADEEVVRQAIWLILATPRRSRIMEPDFGCGLHDFVFAPNNANTRALVEAEVRDALVRWEPRIDVDSVEASAFVDQPNTLLIQVAFHIRANNATGNLVYPFHLSEGSA